MRPTTPPTQSWAQPCDTCIAGVKNFAKVSPTLWRGSQPTEAGFRNLETAGVKTVIDLRDFHDDYDDFSMLGGTNLKYLRIPMHAWNPDQAQLVLLMKVLERTLQDPDSSPVFVHCAAGKDRTGYSIATYRMVLDKDKWTPNDAIAEMYDFRFNAIWFRNPTFLESLDVKKIKDLMKRAP
jgi:protein tyrosine/serine phosphatase